MPGVCWEEYREGRRCAVEALRRELELLVDEYAVLRKADRKARQQEASKKHAAAGRRC